MSTSAPGKWCLRNSDVLTNMHLQSTERLMSGMLRPLLPERKPWYGCAVVSCNRRFMQAMGMLRPVWVRMRAADHLVDALDPLDIHWGHLQQPVPQLWPVQLRNVGRRGLAPEPLKQKLPEGCSPLSLREVVSLPLARLRSLHNSEP